MSASPRRRSRILIAVLLLIMAGSLAAVTFSRYSTKLDGSGRINVAAWSFKAGSQAGSLSPSQIGDIYLIPDSAEGDVSDMKIAPGTSGHFELLADGTGSEVGITVEIALYRDTSMVLPAHLCLYPPDPADPTKPDRSGGSFTVSQASTPEEALAGPSLSFSIPYSSQKDAMKRSLTIFWEWPLDGDGSDPDYDLQDQKDAQAASGDRDFGFKVAMRAAQASAADGA